MGNNEGFEVKVIDKEQEVGNGKSEEAKGKLLRLTTLIQAAGNNKGFEVKVIDKEQEVGDGKSEEAEGNKLEGNKL